MRKRWDSFVNSVNCFKGKEELLSLLRPYPAEEMVAIPVSTLVNSPKNEDPCCVNPL